MATKKRFTYRFDHVRAVWANNDAIMTALGRPNREQVVTHRFSPATMLQMLELTNGKELSDLIKAGAGEWVDRKFDSSDAVPVTAEPACREALGRNAERRGTEIHLTDAIVGSPAKQEGVEDLLWSMMMLPEFQLVY